MIEFEFHSSGIYKSLSRYNQTKCRFVSIYRVHQAHKVYQGLEVYLVL